MASSGVIAGCASPAPPSPTCGKGQEGGAGCWCLSVVSTHPLLCQLGDYCKVLIAEREALWGQALTRPSCENLREGSLATCGSRSPGASVPVRLTTAAPTRDLGAGRTGSSAHPAPRIPCLTPPGTWRAAARFFNSSHFTEEKTVVRDGLVG